MNGEKLNELLILKQLLSVFRSIKSMKVHRAALWILGEYTFTVQDVMSVMNLLNDLLGAVSFCFDALEIDFDHRLTLKLVIL